jgi:K+ transporter
LLAMWFGAALFFSVVVAPAAFGVLRAHGLPNASELAGAIVTRSLSVVNVAGFLIALLLLVTLFVVQRGATGRVAFIIEGVCLVLIAVATSVGHWVIAARMRAIRAALEVPMDQIAADDARRIAFNHLHGYSVNTLGLAMIAALIALVLMARGLRQS